MSYTDGFVVPVPRDRVDDYFKIARQAADIWREHGATEYIECVAEDLDAGPMTSFVEALSLDDDTTVVFSWIRFSSRQERDRVNAAVNEDPRMNEIMAEFEDTMPFDYERMLYGGFDVIVDE